MCEFQIGNAIVEKVLNYKSVLLCGLCVVQPWCHPLLKNSLSQTFFNFSIPSHCKMSLTDVPICYLKEWFSQTLLLYFDPIYV